jgi:predicted nucleic acid-binding protein
MRFALDTNVLAYAQGIDDAKRQTIAERLTERLPVDRTYVSVQVLGELYNVMVKRGRSRLLAHRAAEFWGETFVPIQTTSELMGLAIRVATDHRLKVWDAIVLAGSAEAGCDILVSEDFQEGFAWRGVTVCNPFLAEPHPLIADLVRA